MGIFRDWLDARSARLKEQATRSRAELQRQQRRLQLASMNGTKSPSELLEMQILESSEPLWGGWDRVNFMANDLDRYDFARGGPGFPMGTPSQRKNGADWPFYQNETEHGVLVMASRIAFGTITKAEGLINGMSCYVVGDGATIRVMPKAEGSEETAKAAQKVIDAFRLANHMEEREEEFFGDSRVDGEGIWRLFALEDGRSEVRNVWPEQIRQPAGESFEDFGFGIRTDQDDAETHLEYAIHPTTGDVHEAEFVSADQIIFMPINVRRGIKRGLPDFTWGLLDAVKNSSKLSTKMGIGSAMQASIAFIRQHTGVPGSAIRAFASSDASYTRANQFTGVLDNVKHFEDALVVDTNENTEFLGSPYNAGIASHIDVVKLLDRVACVKYNAPEWLGSADASNNNFASSLVGESPFVKRVGAMQKRYSRPIRTLHERVLLNAVGKIDGIPANILSLVEVKVTFPNPQARDRLQESQRATIRLQNGTTSPQRIADEDGDDWKKVREEITQARAEGWEPPQGGAEKEAKPALPGMPQLGPMESSEDEDDYGAIFEAWDESKHPRDDAGHFVNADAMIAARSDPAKAEELRSQVTYPEQRAKLDAFLKDGKKPKTRKPNAKKLDKAATKRANEIMKAASEAQKSGDAERARNLYAAAYGYHKAAGMHEDGQHAMAEAVKKAAEEFVTGERKMASKNATD